MIVYPMGKWLQIEFEVAPGVVVLTGAADQPHIATVVAVGEAGPTRLFESRILFKKNAAIEEMVDGERVVLLHEDHVLAVLPRVDGT